MVNPLAENQREIYHLHAVEGLSLREIARRVGKCESVVRATYHRAVANGAGFSEGAMAAVIDARLAPQEARGGWIHNYDDEGKKVGTTRWVSPEVAALPPPLDEWAGLIVLSIFGVLGVDRLRK